ncbi:MAG TPA: glycogen debranching protein GlgX [Terriglobales bacterium]|nr:glycogen debranching protein GlgX [Terriglobales bacterium]
MTIWPGAPHPLGSSWDGVGVNFAIFSEHAESVELCLFDEAGGEQRIPLPEHTDRVWHGFVPGIGPGARYGFRAHGRYRPDEGQRFNPAKLLLDPYSRAIAGEVRWGEAGGCDALCGHRAGEGGDDTPDDRDSAAHMPRSVVCDASFPWNDDRAPKTPWHQTIIYEMHVKGFSQRRAEVPEPLRGTYAGLAHPASIAHLQRLGVTAVELMPVHYRVNSCMLAARGLSDYWGYNTIGFFAPDPRFAVRGGAPEMAVREFKAMVRALHHAGLEVILDVVYNHTAEGDERGPTLCFRGVDNTAYYRLAEDRRQYTDFTGCGNTLNMQHPQTLRLIMDSLRYWITEMHVDGFRFDLAATLARELHQVDRLGAFFDIIHQDPVISLAKLIAEPWDLGSDGYQVGQFPVLWSEWNGRYRDTVRDYWRGSNAGVGELAARLTGSSDLYEAGGRRTYASVNFVTAHDGFTLRDLVSYNDKHNEANQEDNRDGSDDNRAWNCGIEGETSDPGILTLRARQRRNLMATLFLSQGVPMMLSGDEIGRTQGGNNNAYCQDNEVSWLDWEAADAEFLAFCQALVGFYRAHPVLRRRQWFQRRAIRGVADISWFRPDGSPMSDEDWEKGYAKALMVFLNGAALPARDQRGAPIHDDSFLLLFNAHHEALEFRLPGAEYGKEWALLLDTATGAPILGLSDPRALRVPSAGERLLTARSLLVLGRN